LPILIILRLGRENANAPTSIRPLPVLNSIKFVKYLKVLMALVPAKVVIAASGNVRDTILSLPVVILESGLNVLLERKPPPVVTVEASASDKSRITNLSAL
jgi:hypothetical protein